MRNTHKIDTMEDVINCVTSENIDNFIIDFTNYLKSAIVVKELIRMSGNDEKIKTTGFTWIDDGEHDCSVKLIQKVTLKTKDHECI